MLIHRSPTHQLNLKRTATKAVFETNPTATFEDGFMVLISLAEIHVPRMWVEETPQLESDDTGIGRLNCQQACMLTFYPDFEVDPPDDQEFFLMIDQSSSMEVTCSS